MQSLWTAASGMNTQQMNIDIISNNISNVNTVGYKKDTLSFKSMLYSTIGNSVEDTGNNTASVPLKKGNGVRVSSISTSYTQGTIQQTNNPLDFAIQGSGFFTVRGADGQSYYTRDGSFKLSVEGDRYKLVTSGGYEVLDNNGNPIYFDSDIDASTIRINSDGYLTYVDSQGEVQNTGSRFQIVQFSNADGLEKVGGNLFAATEASGNPLNEANGETTTSSVIFGGCLEMANVDLANEMVDLIIAQRAYELSARVMQATDEMLGQANQLKR